MLANVVSDILIKALPAIHALTGSDTTSKIGSKTAILKRSVELEAIASFGKAELTNEMIKGAETVLLQLLGHPEFKEFDEYRFQQFYDSKKSLSLKKMVCCSSTIELHIKRAYLQANCWYTANDRTAEPLNPLHYGYRGSDLGVRPLMVQLQTRPSEVIDPCTCAKCARKSCPCRANNIKCLQYCQCSKSKDCKNPLNQPSGSSDED